VPYLGLQAILWHFLCVPFIRGGLLQRRFQKWLGRLFYQCSSFGAEFSAIGLVGERESIAF